MTRDEDRPIGCLLSRRELVLLLGATSTAWLVTGNPDRRQTVAGTHELPCVVRPEQTEGPYFVEERLHRSDIRSDPADGLVKSGTPLALTVQVSRVRSEGCQPLPDAQVDVWHCDAQGVYSDVRDPGFNTIGRKFLRGYQRTDARGEVRFLTVYPGWYSGRTVHIHFKIRTASVARRSFEFTSQWYFSDELTDLVHAAPPYAGRGPRVSRNRHDGIFWRGGSQLMLAPSATTDGYTATFALGLQLP
ncbi:MAG TPA: intradiol ring-cleavage dioxygenase [Nitrospira sp.]|nr:intradiol ring-cleavage dioxygenase [Nitrospira sp.]